MASLTVADLIERNRREVVENWTPMPYLSELSAAGIPPPSILILTCVDPRCEPRDFLGLKPGELVGTIRNVCGHSAPNMNDILALDIFLGLKEILIVHHTDCGATHFKTSQIQEALKARVPGDDSIDGRDFGSIDDLPQSVKDDIAVLNASQLMRKELLDNVHGYVLDIKTGKLNPVEA